MLSPAGTNSHLFQMDEVVERDVRESLDTTPGMHLHKVIGFACAPAVFLSAGTMLPLSNQIGKRLTHSLSTFSPLLVAPRLACDSPACVNALVTSMYQHRGFTWC